MPKTCHLFRFDPETNTELAALAAELRTTRADVVRRAVREMAVRLLPNGRKTILKKSKKNG